MKSTFFRQLTLTAGVLLCSLALMALVFQPLLRTYLVDLTEQGLESNAASVAALAAAYNSSGELESNWDFRISLNFAHQVANNDIVICDTSGLVVLCSCEEISCRHVGLTIPDEILQSAITADGAPHFGKLGEIYDEARYIVAVPIISAGSAETIGVVVTSMSTASIEQLQSRTLHIYISCGVMVLLIAVVASSIMAKRQAKPLKDMAAAAARFGHGELDLRVATGGHNTEEIDELARAFNHMAENLAQSEKRRSEFIANVSHELKTPMTTIAGFMDGMLDGTIPQSDHRRYMQAVSDEVRRLSRLVREMLELSRLRADETISWQVFDLCETLGQSLISYEQRILQKKIDVEVSLPENGCKVLAAPDAITQVVRNLLDNAVKFTPEGGCIRLELATEADKAVTTISNTGPGIPKSELPLIFDRFHKTDKSRSMDRDGVGLGLYIVQTIMNEHGEEITAESENDITRFRFTLPLA